MKFYIIINTHERPKELRRLIRQIVVDIAQSEWVLADIWIQVYIDGCEYPDLGYHYVGVPAYFEAVRWHGKDNYYKLVQMGFKEREEADYYYKIDDDMTIVPGFFEKSVKIWESLPKDKVTLNLLRDQRTDMWGGYPEAVIGKDLLDGSLAYFKSNWVDLNFMCDKKFMEMMDEFDLQPKPPQIKSSGVGRQISRHIRGTRVVNWMEIKGGVPIGSMYQVDKTLLLHPDNGSVMNPEREEILTNV